MAVRDGQAFIDGLSARPREVWTGGRRLAEVTGHPAFRRPLARLAGLFDLQHQAEHRDVMTYRSPATGEPVATAFMPAADTADLQRKHAAYRLAAEATFGMMGRSPDFMNCTLLAFAEGRAVFERGGERFGENIARYYERVREDDLFLTHALISPQNDRSRSSSAQAGQDLHLGLIDQDEEGIVVHGARMLATFGPLADEVLIYNLPNIPAEDARHALIFALPIDAPGLRQVCREPYDTGAARPADHPLAANFEECDSLLIFEHVRVPWDRVFVCNDVATANAIFPDTSLRSYTAHQTSVRGLVKLELAVGVTMALARAVKTDRFLHVQQMLGECVEAVELIKACITRAEIHHEPTLAGSVRPMLAPLLSARTYLARAYPRVIEILQTIGAGGLLMMPATADFEAEIGGQIERYYEGAEGLSADRRVGLTKLAWDLCGEAFGARQLQYERYYAGDPVRNMAANYLGYDRTACDRLVERALSLREEEPFAQRAAARPILSD